LPLVCDPACGYGGFLLGAAKYLHDCLGLDYGTAFERCIVGLDINPTTLDSAAAMIELFLLSEGVNPEGLRLRLRQVDTLCEAPSQILRSVDAEDGFDLIATNPPYIKLQNLEPSYREALLNHYPEFAKGSFSTAMLFLMAGHRLLSSSGILAFITQNNLFTSLAGVQVRRYLKAKRCIRRIVDFGHNQVFANASAYTCLILLGAAPRQSFEFVRIREPASASALERAGFSEIAHDELQTAKWRLAERCHLRNLSRLESIGVPLGEACHIRVGFATLKDKVYLVEQAEDQVRGILPAGEEVAIEEEITRGATKIAEFDHENQLSRNGRRIIFPYTKSGTSYVPIPQAVMKSRYPLCYSYLCEWRAELATRDKGKVSTLPWYAWGRNQSMEAPGPKLLTKTFSDRPNFLMDRSDNLFCNGYAVFPTTTFGLRTLFGSFQLEVVQRILNSCVMDYYARLTSFQIDGDYQCYQKNFIERFNVIPMDDQKAARILEVTDQDLDAYIAELYGIPIEEILDITESRRDAQPAG